MKPLSGHEIRRRWIAFFEEKGHLFVPGVPLVPHNDKSLLFVNAGVTGLKKYFDGTEVPPCRRLVNVQKSIRTNDIENVGFTARHHTFFEMLGNFSIGDYFRKEVIPWAAEILTDEEKGFGLPMDRLYATYNPDDLESYELWQKAGMKKDHLIPLEGNFWEIGEGPSGPNTEVFFDRGEKYDPEHKGIALLENEEDNDRYIELWGIVFSQYNAEPGIPRKEYKELPSKNIDTGAGLERIACILQNTETNFETDLFSPIIHECEKESGIPYKGNELSFRVIADHARCLTFALADGARFSNEGRGYVLRRILRRAMRYARKIGIERPFLYTLLKVVSTSFSDFYPDLLSKVEEDSALVKAEEEKFLKTLSAGEAMLGDILKAGKTLDGETLFKFYDTYGFPADLSAEIAREKGLGCDMEGFEKLLEEAKEKSRASRVQVSGFGAQSADLLAFKEKSEFLYDADAFKSKVIGLFSEGKRVSVLKGKGEIAVAKTPFYAEMGGQCSDIGFVEGKGFHAEVIDVRKAPNGQHLHVVDEVKGEIKEGDDIRLAIDYERRLCIERNHSATHLLHASLCHQLGYTKQEGSYVGPDYLRFDYSVSKKPTDYDLGIIEDDVNQMINIGMPETTLIMPLQKAIDLGAEAEFMEKYGEEVRVVTFGHLSIELCGGTHVRNSAEIGVFKIVSDEAISSGVRRLTAVTSKKAYEYMRKRTAILDEAEEKSDSSDVDFLKKFLSLKERIKELEKENESLRGQGAADLAKDLLAKAETINGIAFIASHLDKASREEVDALGDALKGMAKDSLIILAGGSAPKAALIVLSNGKATEKLGADAAFKAIATILEGRGGGKAARVAGACAKPMAMKEAAEVIKGLL